MEWITVYTNVTYPTEDIVPALVSLMAGTTLAFGNAGGTLQTAAG